MTKPEEKLGSEKEEKKAVDWVAKLLEMPQIPVTLRGIPWNHLALLCILTRRLVDIGESKDAPSGGETIMGALRISLASLEKAMQRTETNAEGHTAFSKMARSLGVPPPKILGYQEVDEETEEPIGEVIDITGGPNAAWPEEPADSEKLDVEPGDGSTKA